METRFDKVLDEMLARRAEGEPLDRVLRRHRDTELVAALAAASGKREPVLANAIATELLNRLRRAPFLGAFYVSATLFVAIFVFDWVFTGSFLLLENGVRAYLLAALAALIALLSLLLLLMWRGRLRRVRMALQRAGRRHY